MSKLHLVKTQFNFADEFDVFGICVICEEFRDYSLHVIEEYFKNWGVLTKYFGTNDYIEFHSAKDILSDTEFIEITEEEYTAYKKIITNNYSYGNKVSFCCILDNMQNKFYDENVGLVDFETFIS